MLVVLLRIKPQLRPGKLPLGPSLIKRVLQQVVLRHQRVERFQQGLWCMVVLRHPGLLNSNRIMAMEQNHEILQEFSPKIHLCAASWCSKQRRSPPARRPWERQSPDWRFPPQVNRRFNVVQAAPALYPALHGALSATLSYYRLVPRTDHHHRRRHSLFLVHHAANLPTARIAEQSHRTQPPRLPATPSRAERSKFPRSRHARYAR